MLSVSDALLLTTKVSVPRQHVTVQATSIAFGVFFLLKVSYIKLQTVSDTIEQPQLCNLYSSLALGLVKVESLLIF